MTRKEAETLWNIVYYAKYHPQVKDLSQDDLAKWISKQLHESLGLCTYPVGSNYFYLGDETGYKAYHESAD